MEYKKQPSELQFVNEYSYLNNKKQRNLFNSFSLDLKRIRQDKVTLPTIKSTQRSKAQGLIEKIKELKTKLQPQPQLKNSYQSHSNIMPMPINYSLPYPMPYQMPYQYPYPYPYPSCPASCPHCVHDKPKKRHKNKNKKKNQPTQIKKKKLNRFRICAYAIYFSIFIKFYSAKFTQNRKKWFMDRYSKRNGGIIYEGSQKVLQKLLALDIYHISQSAKNVKRSIGENNINWEQETKTALVPTNYQEKQNSQKASTGQYIKNATQILLQKIQNIFCEEEFLKEYHQTFSAGSLDKSFLVNNLYLPQQVPFLFVHPKKGYLRLGQLQQKHLLLMKIFIRMIIYNFLFDIEKNKSWSAHMQKTYKLANFQMEQLYQLTRIIGIFIYMVCKDIYIEGIKNICHVSNFYQVSKKYGIKQAKSLQQHWPKAQSQSQKNTTDDFHLIRNIKNLQFTMNKINRNSKLLDYKIVLKQKINDMLNFIHASMKKQQKQLYLYVKNITLTNKFIILQGIESAKNKSNKKQKSYQLALPNKTKGVNWNNLYSERPSQGKSENTNNSFQSRMEAQAFLKPMEQTLKFDNSKSNNFQRLPRKYMQQTQKMINDSLTTNKQKLFLQQQTQQKNVFKPNSNTNKASIMKKAFNIDTVNAKFDENRQDRLRQKFKNMLSGATNNKQNKNETQQ